MYNISTIRITAKCEVEVILCIYLFAVYIQTNGISHFNPLPANVDNMVSS
jgi:hypothetical protein